MKESSSESLSDRLDCRQSERVEETVDRREVESTRGTLVRRVTCGSKWGVECRAARELINSDKATDVQSG